MHHQHHPHQPPSFPLPAGEVQARKWRDLREQLSKSYVPASILAEYEKLRAKLALKARPQHPELIVPGLEYHVKGLSCNLLYSKGGACFRTNVGGAETQMEGAAIIAAALRFARNRNDRAAKAVLSGNAADRIELDFHQLPKGKGPRITWQGWQEEVVKVFGFEV